MNKKSFGSKEAAETLVKNIRCRTSRKYSAEEKIRIVLAGLRGEIGGDYVKWLLDREPNAANLIGPRNQKYHDYTCPQAI